MRVAMVGVGGFGGARRNTMRETGLFEIVSAYDINPQALAHAEEVDGARAVGSYEELLEVPGIEAMVISTGGKFHTEQALAAMERGLHVFVEKPLCATREEALALLEMQRKTERVVVVGHFDHHSDVGATEIKRLIAAGELGTVATFQMETAHSGGLEIKPGDWRGDPEKNPGGMLFQCGCHALHELMFLFGPIVRVSSMMRYDVHTTLTADVAHCLLEFESGLIGTLGAYHVTPYRHSLNIFGTKKSLYRDLRCPAYGDSSYVALQERRRGEAELHVPYPLPSGIDHCGAVRNFYRAVREGVEPYPSLLDGARAVMVVFAAEEAAKTGKTVTIDWEL